MAEFDPIKVLKWKAGRPAEIWLSHRELVAGFVKKFNLKALEVEAYPFVPAMNEVPDAPPATKAKAVIEMRPRWPKPFPGGLRIPHLHHGADIYLMDRAQWQDFSGAVLRDVQARLAKVEGIGFEQTLELTEAVSTLP